MKKQSKINLHNLSQSEVASRELSLLKGGAACVTICSGSICGCFESNNDSVDVTLKNINDTQMEKVESDKNLSGQGQN